MGRKDYTQLDSSYSPFLDRKSDLSFSLQNADDSDGDNAKDSGFSTGGSQAGGSVATVALKTEGNATDVWIQNFLRSVNWKPKSVGFYIDGRTGYAEFANVYISGTIVVEAGSIGGFDIGPDYIRDHLNTMGMASTDTVGNDVRFWAGTDFDDRATAPFRVMEDGSVNASDITITGTSLVDTSVLDGLIAQNNLSIANQSWGQSCTFTPIDFNTVNWGTGTISFSDGTDYTISSGSTGNIVPSKMYVYFDLDISTTAYQTTTDISDTTGPNKAVIAVVTKNPNPALKATYQLFGGGGGVVVDGGALTPGSVTYTELAYPPTAGSGAPTSTPTNFGMLYIDQTNNKAYISLGTTTPADWREITLGAVPPRTLSVFDTVTVTESVSNNVV